jgi:hypothetical protein
METANIELKKDINNQKKLLMNVLNIINKENIKNFIDNKIGDDIFLLEKDSHKTIYINLNFDNKFAKYYFYLDFNLIIIDIVDSAGKTNNIQFTYSKLSDFLLYIKIKKCYNIVKNLNLIKTKN